MPKSQIIQSINWNNLVEAINNDECVLVLGPNISTLEQSGQMVSLQQLLAEHLAEELKKINPHTYLLNTTDLAYIAKQLEDALLVQTKDQGRARFKLGEMVQTFYQKYNASHFPVFSYLARLPFRFIVNTCPDNFLLEAFDSENKLDAKSVHYNYSNPKKNKYKDINIDHVKSYAPLVFNLFGAIDSPDSMVITESDQLNFLDTILQKESTAGIPNKIAIEFTPSEKGFEKNFIFLGFDFNQWHLRLILHLINRYQKQKETYALQNPKDLSELTNFFYKRNFEVEFVDIPPQQFATTFLEKINKKKAPIKESPKLKAFLMFADKDAPTKEILDTQLAALKRNEFIETWDEEQILPGSKHDEEIEQKLNQADIILLLVTANLFNSNEVFEKQLQRALYFHQQNKAVLIPILMKSCLWEGSIISDLTTILPRNRISLDMQENPTASLADTIQQLEGWCKKIYKRKMRTFH